MKKNLIIFLLCLLPVLFSDAGAQSAVFLSGDWICSENETGVTLQDYLGNETELEIPSAVDGQPVTQLGNDLFYDNMQLRSVVIPGTVTAIGSNAFNSCTRLEEVQLSFSIKTIATGTFRNCISLKSINLPNTVKSIGNYAFMNCRKLQEIFLKSVSSVGESAFENCEALSRVFVTKNLTYVAAFAFRNTAWLDKQKDEFVFIGKGVLLKWNGSGREVTLPWGTVMISGTFAENETIESVTLPDTVRNIGQYAFRNAVNLKKVNIPIYVTTIGASAFEGCRSLTELELPGSVTSINTAAFRNCERLKAVNIPKKVKSIAYQTFTNCPSLRSVSIPATVTKIDKNAFSRSEHIELRGETGSAAEAFAEEHENAWQYEIHTNGDLLYTHEKAGINIVRYTGSQTDVTIPNKIDGVPVTAIGEAAFQNNSCVREVILPASVKKIGSWAFSYMAALENIQIPAGVKAIGNNVFTGSLMLRQIRLPRRLQEIGILPFDPDAGTIICLQEDSSAARSLQDMGYDVQPVERCTLLGSQTEQNGSSKGAAITAGYG